MKHVFNSKTAAKVRPNDILVKSNKTANCGGKSLAVQKYGINSPKISNQY